MKVHVINLASSAARRRSIESQLEPLGVDYSFFEAIEGMRGFEHFASYDERAFQIRTGRRASPNEAACYASHLSLWTLCAERRQPIAVLEDDARFEPDFVAAMACAERSVSRYGFIRLQTDGPDRKPCRWPIAQVEGFTLSYYTRYPFGAMAYVLNPEVAARFVALSRRFREPVDCFIKRFWHHGQPLFGLSPHAVSAAACARASTIALRDKSAPSLGLRLARARCKWGDAMRRARFNQVYLARSQDEDVGSSLAASP